MKQSQNPFELITIHLNTIERSNHRIEMELRDLKIGCPNYTRSEAAEVLGVSLPTIDRLITSQKLTKIKIGSKTLIPKDQVNELAAGNEQSSSAV